MCILAGCDYLSSIPGVGIKTAHGALRQYRSVERALTQLQRKLWLNVDDEQRGMLLESYLSQFYNAQQAADDRGVPSRAACA